MCICIYIYDYMCIYICVCVSCMSHRKVCFHQVRLTWWLRLCDEWLALVGKSPVWKMVEKWLGIPHKWRFESEGENPP